VAQIGQSLIIMPRTGRGGNGGFWWQCTVGLLQRTELLSGPLLIEAEI
jgi:hypothetical protein